MTLYNIYTIWKIENIYTLSLIKISQSCRSTDLLQLLWMKHFLESMDPAILGKMLILIIANNFLYQNVMHHPTHLKYV